MNGVFGSPDRWHFPYFNDEMGAEVGSTMAAADAMLMGRVTYQEWAEYWPLQKPYRDEIAEYMNGVRIYVGSTTLGSVKWHISTLVTSRTRSSRVGISTCSSTPPPSRTP